MRAIVRDRFGGPEVLRLAELPRPVPAQGQVLVRVHAASVNPADRFFLAGTPWVTRPMSGILRPRHRVLGRDVAGEVAELGPGVTTWQVGDAVYGEADFGSLAEYVLMPADRLAAAPTRAGFVESAAVPLAGVTALQGLRDAGRLTAGGQLLVNGAAGGVGTFAVQIGSALGAEVTGVVRSDAVDLMTSLGADHVVDYTREDFTAGSTRYDVILDLAGSQPVRACRRVLSPTGRYVASTGRMSRVVAAAASSVLHRSQVTVFLARSTAADLATLATMIDEGTVTPVIDRVLPLDDAPKALQHLIDGHARGKTVVQVVEG
ncbi:MAG: NAD(P)-dependent alcohol dehydrogenase [Candidatus Nanopelagicales bacterium]